MLTPFRIRLLYALHVVAAVVFFLYVLFPAESVKKGFTDRFDRTYSPNQLRIENIRLAFPLSLLLQQLTVQDSTGPRFTISKLEISPRIFSLIRGQKSILFNGNAYEGTFGGDIDCNRENWTLPERVSLNVSNLKIKEAPIKAIEGTPLFSGVLEGNATYTRIDKSGDLVDAVLGLKETTITLPALPAEAAKWVFEKADVSFSVEKQTLTFRQFVFTGPQLDGSITGTIRLLEPADKSNLNLRLEISIRPEFQEKLAQMIPLVLLSNRNSSQGGLKLRVFGTLDKPGFSITR